MTVLVRAVDLQKTYGSGALETHVLHGVSLAIAAGELVLIMGPSGSGKTTLLSILGGLMRPNAGAVELCGTCISKLPEEQVSRMRREHLGFVFQSCNLFPALSALENVTEVLRLKGARSPDARARAALERVGLQDRCSHKPGQLSGGQKQRVAIARAIAPDPNVIMGDEVTSALDGETAMDVLRLLREWVDASRAVVLVTHDYRMQRFADRILSMEDGRVVSESAGGWR